MSNPDELNCDQFETTLICSTTRHEGSWGGGRGIAPTHSRPRH
jgi:hypothetical protein